MSKPFYNTGNEYFRELIDEWQRETGATAVNTEAAVKWALENKKLVPAPYDVVRDYMKKFSRAMRELTESDPQGRRVRKWHANKHYEEDAEGIRAQKVLWYTRDTITQDQMELAVQQRRQQIVGDCAQLKTDSDSFNENRGDPERPILVHLDFTNDVAEREQSTTYGSDDGDDGGDDDKL